MDTLRSIDGRARPPELFDDLICRKRLIRVEKEQGEKRAFTTAHDPNRFVLGDHLQQPKQPELHPTRRYHPG